MRRSVISPHYFARSAHVSWFGRFRSLSIVIWDLFGIWCSRFGFYHRMVSLAQCRRLHRVTPSLSFLNPPRRLIRFPASQPFKLPTFPAFQHLAFCHNHRKIYMRSIVNFSEKLTVALDPCRPKIHNFKSKNTRYNLFSLFQQFSMVDS
jgi:hypothetical protein